MIERLRVMLFKEYIELWRDPWAIFRLIVPLVLQVIIYGYAATFDVSHVATAIVDLDRSQASRDLVSRFSAAGRFDIVRSGLDEKEALHDIDTDRAVIAVIIHAGFGQHLADGSGAPLGVVVDGSNSNTAMIAAGYVGEIVAQFEAQRSADLRAMNAVSPFVAVSMQQRPWFNVSLDDRWFFIPGVIGTLTLMQVISLTAFAIVRERELGTLEQVLVTPIRPFEFILGKTIPFFMIGLVDILIVALLGVFWFDVPFIGSPFVMLVGASLFLLAALGLGLFLSTVSQTQQQAFSLNFFILNPIFILSGFAFPISSMPAVLQWLTLVNPLRYFLVVIRGVFLKGVGFAVLWPQMAALALFAIAMLSISVLRFRKSLD
ncbi:ABC transporter permease [Rhizobium sp. BK376]|uniref:ABC transporter permease n=1 Tax=Rhizobium sp. BK376 TaxID=2512149 RepID=UPI00104CF88D|nr:ABC transporter permease [Rhizobium sp. BK376]TCR75628.1 ABC-2 type transport system permease protein [Rhizobium sp. BK376]